MLPAFSPRSLAHTPYTFLSIRDQQAHPVIESERLRGAIRSYARAGMFRSLHRPGQEVSGLSGSGVRRVHRNCVPATGHENARSSSAAGISAVLRFFESFQTDAPHRAGSRRASGTGLGGDPPVGVPVLRTNVCGRRYRTAIAQPQMQNRLNSLDHSTRSGIVGCKVTRADNTGSTVNVRNHEAVSDGTGHGAGACRCGSCVARPKRSCERVCERSIGEGGGM